MSHYEDQERRLCNNCNTYSNAFKYPANDEGVTTTCLCTNKREYKNTQERGTVKSDGGSSSYYQLQLLVNSNKIKELEGHDEVKVVELETGDIIRSLVDNDFDLGNIIKACRRIHQAKKGTGKAGTDVEYDCKKIEYFLKEWYNAYAMEQL